MGIQVDRNTLHHLCLFKTDFGYGRLKLLMDLSMTTSSDLVFNAK